MRSAPVVVLQNKKADLKVACFFDLKVFEKFLFDRLMRSGMVIHHSVDLVFN